MTSSRSSRPPARALILVCALLSTTSSLAGCRPCPAAEVSPKLIESARACWHLEPPPQEKPVAVVKGSSDQEITDCPSTYSVCLRRSAGLALVENLNEYRRWVREAWRRCGDPALASAADILPVAGSALGYDSGAAPSADAASPPSGDP